MIVGRIIGWTLVLFAVALLAWEATHYLDTGAYRPIAAGEVWYRIDAGSLNMTQAGVQRHVHPALWDPVLLTILTWPAWVVAGAPGLVLLYLFRRRRRTRPRFRR